MSKQTAVEWLVEQLLANGLLRLTKDEHSVYKALKEQANAMFEEQIIDAHMHMRCIKTDDPYQCSNNAVYQSRQYYNETYKGGEQ